MAQPALTARIRQIIPREGQPTVIRALILEDGASLGEIEVTMGPSTAATIAALRAEAQKLTQFVVGAELAL